jgi:hypothetical protein
MKEVMHINKLQFWQKEINYIIIVFLLDIKKRMGFISLNGILSFAIKKSMTTSSN